MTPKLSNVFTLSFPAEGVVKILIDTDLPKPSKEEYFALWDFVYSLHPSKTIARSKKLEAKHLKDFSPCENFNKLFGKNP